MNIKTSELNGAALDWAVAKSEGSLAPLGNLHPVGKQLFIGVGGDLGEPGEWAIYQPSTDWSQGGPIIAQLPGFQLKNWLESHPESRHEAHIHNYEGDWIAFGPTALIAAMRCLVASKLGNEVDVPEN